MRLFRCFSIASKCASRKATTTKPRARCTNGDSELSVPSIWALKEFISAIMVEGGHGGTQNKSIPFQPEFQQEEVHLAEQGAILLHYNFFLLYIHYDSHSRLLYSDSVHFHDRDDPAHHCLRVRIPVSSSEVLSILRHEQVSLLQEDLLRGWSRCHCRLAHGWCETPLCPSTHDSFSKEGEALLKFLDHVDDSIGQQRSSRRNCVNYGARLSRLAACAYRTRRLWGCWGANAQATRASSDVLRYWIVNCVLLASTPSEVRWWAETRRRRKEEALQV